MFNPGFVNLNEIYVSKSKIEIKDGFVGIFDNLKSKIFLDLKDGLKNNYKLAKSEELSGNKDELLWYTNFISNPSARKFKRTRFNLVDLIESAGGMFTSLIGIGKVIHIVLTFKK